MSDEHDRRGAGHAPAGRLTAVLATHPRRRERGCELAFAVPAKALPLSTALAAAAVASRIDFLSDMGMTCPFLGWAGVARQLWLSRLTGP